MKRYLIFAVVVPFVGGLLMLFATTMASGYWTETNLREVGKFFGAFIKTLQYSYLFGIVPALMVGAIDDILVHVRRIRPALRMLIVGAIGFTASFFFGSRGPDTGVLQLLLNGLVGMAPAMLASWLSHRYADTPQPVPST